MKDKFFQELTPEVKEKTAKNLVYVGMIGIVMLFAGLSSAYIVSMGDSFWVKFPLPCAFWVSTVVIVLGSLFFHLAIRLMKNGKSKQSAYLVLATTLTGVLFGVTQYLGYRQLVDKGAYVVSNILVSNGRYGDYYEIRMDNALLVVDGNDFYKRGELLNVAEMKELKSFATKFLHSDTNVVFNVPEYGTRFSLTYHAEPLALVNGKLIHSNGEELQRTDLIRLNELMMHVAAGRGDFFLKGKVGIDFKLYYHGEEVTYENRELFYQGKRLKKGLELKLIDSRDNATAYLYIITILHLVHILFMVGYMISFTKRTFSGQFSAQNTLGMRATAIFWHFLGALWIYLLLFLLFIH
jgi:cytochrome c oxidase subunit III